MSDQQAVIATFVSDHELDVYEVEDQLIEAIEKAGVGEFDGNLMGPGEIVLYAYGPDADALFEVMEPIRSCGRFRRGRRTRSSGTGRRVNRTRARCAWN